MDKTIGRTSNKHKVPKITILAIKQDEENSIERNMSDTERFGK